MNLERFKEAAIALVLVALIIGAFVLALDAFQEDMDSDLVCPSDCHYNTTSRSCVNASNSPATCLSGGLSVAFNVTQEGLEGTSNASSYLSTIGTLIGVAALIAVVMGAFYFVRR